MIPKIGKTYRISCIHKQDDLQHMNYEGIGKCHEKCKGKDYEGLWLFFIDDSWNMFEAKDIVEEVAEGIRL
jgi:hypothetical protein